MSDRSTDESSASQPSQTATHADDAAQTRAKGRAPAGSPRKPRTKRPRPTFDDGALTRVFKFPSKTYPRSTYYMTSTEIIIRIKKARKKWKIVVPKKRVTSFRTNRWFAKPRWVELELTYTQAVRLGFIEARPRTVDDPVRDTTATPVVERDAQAEALIAEETADEAMSDAASAWQEVQDGDQDSAEFDAAFDREGADSVADSDLSDFERAAEPALEAEAITADEARDHETAGGEDEPHDADQHDAPVVEEIAVSAPPVVAEAEATHVSATTAPPETATLIPTISSAPALVTTQDAVLAEPIAATATVPTATPPQLRPRADSPTRRANAALAMASLALLLVGAAVAWTLFGDTAPTQMADGTVCVRSGLSMSCSQMIVTGAVNRDETPQGPESSVQAATETHVSSVATTEIGASEPAVPALPKIAMRPGESDAGAGLVGKSQPSVAAPSGPDGGSIAPTKTAALDQRLPMRQTAVVDRHDCRQLSAAADAFVIPFGYASAALDPAVITSLEAFARWLLACPSARLTIEGHTDADGHADRNQVLSMRRAQAVLDHLVAAGVKAEQVSLIGFGASRPYAPNVSPQTKRMNRRAALVVAAPR